MNYKLYQLFGCEIKELDLCKKCNLFSTTICNCCKSIVEIQTPIHVDNYDL